MKSVLFVSIAFPPKSDAEGLQVAKYLKYLRKVSGNDWAIDAVTSALPTLNMPFDADLLPAAAGVRQTVALPLFENRYLNYLLRKLFPRLLYSPDPKFSFHLQSWRVPLLLKHRPDLIYSRAFPTSSAVLGLKLKRHYQVPWVMHLSDLWADCPEARYQGALMERQQSMERQCFENADVICLTSRKTLEFYTKKYASLNKRIEFFPNVYDPEDIPSRDRPPDDRQKLRIVHTGSLAGDRSAEPFLRALGQLNAEQLACLEVLFAGPADRKNAAIFKKYNLECVEYRGPVPYREALALQQSADLLLLIDMPVEPVDRRVFFPSKLLDYMIAQRPILALVDPQSEVERFLTERGDPTLARHQTTEIANFLAKLIQTGRGTLLAQPVQKDFDAAWNAARLKDLFGSLG